VKKMICYSCDCLIRLRFIMTDDDVREQKMVGYLKVMTNSRTYICWKI
jgi:hypothetical protein